MDVATYLVGPLLVYSILYAVRETLRRIGILKPPPTAITLQDTNDDVLVTRAILHRIQHMNTGNVDLHEAHEDEILAAIHEELNLPGLQNRQVDISNHDELITLLLKVEHLEKYLMGSKRYK